VESLLFPQAASVAIVSVTAFVLLFSAISKFLTYEQFVDFFSLNFSSPLLGRFLMAAELIFGFALLIMLPFDEAIFMAALGAAAIGLFRFVARVRRISSCDCFGQLSRYTGLIVKAYALCWVAFFLSLSARADQINVVDSSAIPTIQLTVFLGAALLAIYSAPQQSFLKFKARKNFLGSVAGVAARQAQRADRTAVLLTSRLCPPCVPAVADFEAFSGAFCDKANFFAVVPGYSSQETSEVGNVTVYATELSELGLGKIAMPALLIIDKFSRTKIKFYSGLPSVRRGLGELLGT